VAEKYAGFLPHLERYLGEAREFEEPTVAGPNRGFGLFFCHSRDGRLISVVTNGLRFQQLTVVLPQELVCTVRSEHRKAAHLLVALSAELVLRRGAGLILDEIIPAPGPLVPGTGIEAVVASVHPYVDTEDFNTLTDDTGRTELQLITLLPATRAEFELADRAGIDELFGTWEDTETDLLDPTRTSAV
jgi:hypothetical protein